MNAENKFMKVEEVYELTGKKRTALYKLRKEKGFPEPVLTHPAKFLRSDVMHWLESGGVNRAS